ncbi:glycosyltransferase family 2 protein [Algoriphagus hitonicola]|uniref:Dolichol-phosphate mannosyltransferase n=1 Tax=Algoriphagus hitonicola TaxID=435880 RepID=A0A1I2XTF6_9BACT|nr:glycosyltransferase family 2 protein [Algoriphagus hitonicola]SFH16655.1 dolichol-phosphate mannosyltransferase [Algoriphagus hitonicola]
MPHLSIISPVFQSASLVEPLVREIVQAIEPLNPDFEIILVEDGSTDDSWQEITRVTEIFPQVKGIKLSRNFGQHYAITAGLDQASGEWICVMDCDLQDLPSEIPKLYQKAQEGFQIVQAQRKLRQDSFFKKTGSLLFYRILTWLTGVPQDESIGNFGIYHHTVIKEIVSMRESIRYFPTMVQWVGFRKTSIPVSHGKNQNRKTTYNPKRLFNLALDIMLAYSDKPIRLTVKLGFIVAISGFLFAGFTGWRFWMGDIIVAGYASLIISIWVLSGFLLMTLGMVGLYIGKTFEGVKNRPIYIVEKETHS